MVTPMKLILLLTIACLQGLAQDQSRLDIVLTNPDGTKNTVSISGKPAAAGLDILRQWMATQQVCPTPETCGPKYPNGAAFVKSLVLDATESIAKQGGYVSAELKADADEIKAKIAALEAKRAAAFAAARAQK